MFIESTLSIFNTYLLSPISTTILLIGGIILTIRLKFLQFTNPVRLIKTLTKKSSKNTSPFRALTLALAGTLGVGNISGVAIALSCGGAGALLWMWISAAFAMIVKYAEIVLAVHYRTHKNNEAHGGAMYYIKKGIKDKKAATIIATVFSILCIFSSLSTGSVIQINSAAEAAYESYGIPQYLTGLLIAFFTFIALLYSKKITSITVKLVPVMSAIFIILSSVIIVINIKEIPSIINLIISDAFSANSFSGGILGFISSKCIRQGVTKGLFSNEAGCGTSTIAHAQADTTSSYSQGLWGIFEVFFDTIVLCTLTGFVLLLTYGNATPDVGGGVAVTLRAYASALGPIARHLLSLSIILFAYATIICWAHYGCESVLFISDNKRFKYCYIAFYILSIIYGAVAPSSAIWEVADLSIYLLLIINTLCVLSMTNTVIRLTKNR